MTRNEALACLRAALPDLRAGYGVARLGVFGSVARNEAGDDSDVDLVAEFTVDSTVSAFGLLELEAHLTQRLGRPARIAALSRMNRIMRASVERDLEFTDAAR